LLRQVQLVCQVVDLNAKVLILGRQLEELFCLLAFLRTQKIQIRLQLLAKHVDVVELDFLYFHFTACLQHLDALRLLHQLCMIILDLLLA
jgi:hypothetical protein